MVTVSDKAFTGSIPETYDRYMVPLIFEAYARGLADLIARVAPRDLLETAAGTGVLTRALVSTLPLDTAIVATDLNQPMLSHAATKLPSQDRLTWRQADALALPFEDEQFDAVACQFGAMFFPDKIKGYREARRVLRPHGYFFFNVWDCITENEFADVVTAALAGLFPQDPPLFLARSPHGYYDVETIRDQLRAAGFADVSIETVAHMSRAASAREAAIAYCQGTPLRNEIEARDASRLEDATSAATDAIARRFGNGPVEGRISAHVVTATG